MKLKEPINEIDLERKHDFSKLFDLVAYQDINDHFGYWNTRDQDFTCFIKINAIDSTVLDVDHMEAISKAFGRATASLPGGADVSYYRFVHRDIYDKIDKFVESQNDDDLSKLILESVVDHQIEGSKSQNGFFADVSPSLAKQALEHNKRDIAQQKANQRPVLKNSHPLPKVGMHSHEIDQMVAIRFGSDFFKSTNIEKLKVTLGVESSDHFNSRKYFSARDRYVASITDFLEIIHSFGFSATVMTAQGLIDVLYRFVNPTRYYAGHVPAYNNSLTVPQMIGIAPIESNHSVGAHVGMSDVEFLDKGMNIESAGLDTFYYRATSVATIPRFPVVNQLEKWLTSIEGESLFVINFHINTDTQRSVKLMKNKLALTWNERWRSSTFRSTDGFQEWHEDIKIYSEMTNPMDAENLQKDVNYSIHYIPFGRNEKEVEERAQRAAFAFNANGRYEKNRGGAICFSSIPGRFKGTQMPLIGRTFGSTTGVVAHVMPIYCHYQGIHHTRISDAAVMANNRSGTPIFLDLFSAPKTAHTLVVGGTGTGKSFTVNQIISQMMAKARPKTWIIDRGGSFKPMANLWGGAHLDITSTPGVDEEQTILNPFLSYQNTEGEFIYGNTDDLNAIASTLKLMIQMIDSERHFTAIESNLIDMAIKKYMTEIKNIDTEGTFSEFIELSLNTVSMNDYDGKKLALELAAYYGDGKFSGIFDGHSTFSWDNDLIVIETQRIPSQILPLVMILLFSNIDAYAKVKLKRSRKKLLAIDEAWAALAYEELINVVAGFFREMRKYQMGIILISQTITEFVKLATMGKGTSDTDGIFANVANFILLPVSQIDYTAAKKELGFSDNEVNAWMSLEGNPPFYSEVFYRFRNRKDTFENGIFRVYSSSVLLWASTTNAVDVDIRDELISELMVSNKLSRNKATAEACKKLAVKMPYGSELMVHDKEAA
jgi:hypothetical protein